MEEETIEEINSRHTIGKIKLKNKNFSLIYTAYNSPIGIKVVFKLYNEVDHRPVSRMSSIVLNEAEINTLIDTLQALKTKVKEENNVSDNM
jgi:hypothetical protein